MGELILYCLLNLYMSAAMFLTTSYAYFKTTVSPIHERYQHKSLLFAGCIIVSVVFAIIYPISNALAQLFCYLYPSVFFIIFEKQNRKKIFFICFILSTFTRILLIIPTMLLATVLVVLNYSKSLFFSLFIVYALTFVLTFLLLKIKRFEKGFQFFQSEKNLGLGLIIAGAVFTIMGLVYTRQYFHFNETFVVITLLGLFIIGFGLYLWIRRSITAHYRERLQLKSEEHYQALLKEKEIENKKLNQTNEYLAKVVHRDNHLISALNTSINAYFESDDEPFKDNLLREIQTLAIERSELIEKEQREAKLLPSTGNLLIDGAINNLYIKAAAHGIDFNLTVSKTVDEIIGKYISQTELQTLICDHIKDAIIAVDAKENNNGKILVDLSVKNDNYHIAVFDNGVNFEIDTLSKLGKERVTTHADNGGNGIGFITTFETLRKSYASLMITEFKNKVPFSKSVSILFDGNNAFMIQSYRKEELVSKLNRDDVIIL